MQQLVHQNNLKGPLISYLRRLCWVAWLCGSNGYSHGPPRQPGTESSNITVLGCPHCPCSPYYCQQCVVTSHWFQLANTNKRRPLLQYSMSSYQIVKFWIQNYDSSNQTFFCVFKWVVCIIYYLCNQIVMIVLYEF